MSGFIHRETAAARARAALIGLAAICAAAALTACQAPLSVVNDASASNLTTTATPSGPGDGHHPTTTPAAPTTTSTTSTGTSTTTTAGAPAGADPDPNCTLIVPPAPLSAAGLATPYRFGATDTGAGPCHEANPDQSAFVEATILDPATGRLAVYHPLVIDEGTQPAIPPVRPTLPGGAVVGVWFGFQADVLTLHQRHFRRGAMRVRMPVGNDCVNGSPDSPFSQFAYCNAPQFFAAANAAIKAGKLQIPALGTDNDGKPCPTTRDFSVVDQDQSDNLPGSYLATADGRIAQFSAANQRTLSNATVLNNASDNGLVDDLLDPALGCHPATAPDLAAGGAPSPALALNELQAAADQGSPVALVPLNDPMTLDNNGKASVAKTNLYRAGVDMPRINPATETGTLYCTDMAAAAVPRLALDEPERRRPRPLPQSPPSTPSRQPMPPRPTPPLPTPPLPSPPRRPGRARPPTRRWWRDRQPRNRRRVAGRRPGCDPAHTSDIGLLSRRYDDSGKRRRGLGEEERHDHRYAAGTPRRPRTSG